MDLYLQPWERFASRSELQAGFQLSRCVASIVKALSWRQTVAPLEGTLREEYAWIVPELLREFLHHEGLLAA